MKLKIPGLQCLSLHTFLLFLLFQSTLYSAQRAGEEIRFPSDEFAKLDTFEGLNLEDADKLYDKKDYRGAMAAYKAYSNEFPKGKAMAYALLRMGRCLHMMKKRNSAVRAYQEVIDYFPNDVRYAAGAYYYMGLAHQENGDHKKCLATWAKLVKDKDYVSQPNSGTALRFLAAEMEKVKKFDEAVEYNWRIAVTFRVKNREAAEAAKKAVHFHYTVRAPNHEKFMEFYKEVGGWHRNEPLKDLENSAYYWSTAMDIFRHDPRGFPNVSEETRSNSASYWIGKFGARLPKNDGLRKTAIDLQYIVDKNQDNWVASMNKQADSMPMTVQRLIWWTREFGRNPKAQAEFLGKHGKVLAGAKVKDVTELIGRLHWENRINAFEAHLLPGIAAMKRSEQFDLLKFLTSRNVKMYEQAKFVMQAMKLDGMTDKELITMGNYAGDLISEDSALGYFKKLKNRDDSMKATYDWYLKKSTYDGRNFNKDMGLKALAMMPEISKNPEWSQGTLWPKARILHRSGQFPAAIKAYKASNRQPDATWQIVECMLATKQYKDAINTTKGLESIGGAVAAKACFKVADIYRIMGDKGKEVEQLRLVLRRYPSSGESSAAHRRLEDLGAKITGGKATADEK